MAALATGVELRVLVCGAQTLQAASGVPITGPVPGCGGIGQNGGSLEWRSLRYARVPPMDYLDKPRSNERGSGFNRRNRAEWVRIQPALTSATSSRALSIASRSSTSRISCAANKPRSARPRSGRVRWCVNWPFTHDGRVVEYSVRAAIASKRPVALPTLPRSGGRKYDKRSSKQSDNN
jgi:hypothetical protein